VPADLTGTWTLVAWRRVADDGTVSHPVGEDAHGLLIYTADGRMAVQLAAADRPPIESEDPPLGGDAQARADAYSTCLAYYGTYEVKEDSVVHNVEVSLFPNWSGAVQERPFTYDGHELVLRTPPMPGPHGTVVNELAWAREDRG